MSQSIHRLSLKRIEQAAKSIDTVFLNSPQFECEPIDKVLGTRLVLKVETLNPIRSFKGRGADASLVTLRRQSLRQSSPGKSSSNSDRNTVNPLADR